MKVNNKVVVITGASGAIGSAVAKRFADEESLLLLNSNTRPRNCEQLIEDFRARGLQAFHHHGDVSTPQGANALIEAAKQHFGRVDILLNIAGATVGGGPVEDLTESDWNTAFAANFYSAVHCTQAALPHMRQGGGRIVNTSSVRGLWAGGRPAIMAYSMAKAALINYTSTLAKAVGPDILVNAIAPGFVYTPNYEAMPDEQTRAFIEATTLKRFIMPEEVADSYLFLASTTCITGQTLVVDGGFTLITD